MDTPLIANIITSVTSKDVEISTKNEEFMDVMDHRPSASYEYEAYMEGVSETPKDNQ